MTRDTRDALSRRSFSRAVAVGTLASLAGCSWFGDADRDDPPPERETEATTSTPVGQELGLQRFDIPFEIQTVERLTPGTDLDLESLTPAPGTVYYLEPGRYPLHNHLGLSGFTDFALVSDAAVLEPVAPASETGGYVLSMHGENLCLAGLEFDYTQEGYGGRVQCISRSGLTVRDVVVNGPIDGDPRKGAFRFDVREPDGRGLVENVVARDGGYTVGMFVGLQHAGKLTVRNCHMEGFGDNGLYGSPPSRRDHGGAGGGTVHVEGGLFKNNNVAQVRVGGESTIRNVDIVVDTDDIKNKGGTVNARGIRFDEAGGGLVENCDIVLEASKGLGGVVQSGTAGACTVRDTNIRLDSERHTAAINGRDTDTDTGSTYENVEITGSAPGATAVQLTERDGCTFRNVAISQDGPDSTGFHLVRSQDISITSSSIEVNGQRFALERSSLAKVELVE